MSNLKPVHDGLTDLLKRGVALFIDLSLPFLVAFGIGALIHLDDETSTIFAWIVFLVYYLASLWGYGRTFGYKVFGWELLRRDHSKPSVIRLIVRLALFIFTFTGIGSLVAIVYFFATGNVSWWNGVTDTDLFEKQV